MNTQSVGCKTKSLQPKYVLIYLLINPVLWIVLSVLFSFQLDPALLEMPQPPAGAASDELFTMGGTFQEFMERAEAAYIKRQLERHHWNISKTAEALDIQRSHLYTKMKRYGLAKGGADDEGDS